MNSQLDSVRAYMREKDVQALIFPMNDPHLSEYVADHWKTVEWISGFTGSAGTVVVTQNFAGLWTDSRYFIQGEKQLETSGVKLMKLIVPHTPEYIGWLKENLKKGDSVGIDGRLISGYSLKKLRDHFSPAGILVETKVDAASVAWKNRPPLPQDLVFIHEEAFSGKSLQEKIVEIRVKLTAAGAQYALLTALDDIAWTFNLRGSDVEFNPVFYAYALIGPDSSTLFIREIKISDSVRKSLNEAGVKIRDYDEVVTAMNELPAGSQIHLDTKQTASAILDAVPKSCEMVKGDSIPQQLKAIKNATETENVRKVMERDAVALLKLYRWLEAEKGNAGVTEAAVGDKLAAFRAEGENYVGESFPAIVGFDGNGAIVHYRPEHGSSAEIAVEGMLLLDSGGQYLDGTTDITRTSFFGTPSEIQKKHYTLVLKGHIGLSRLKFPRGTTGAHIDVLARQHLWALGLNYGHGTGHGVGSFLNVHEGPHGISPMLTGRGAVPMKPGMIISNEPGYYREGEYGIRIENLILVIESPVGDNFYEFETLTLFPIDTNLVATELLEPAERNWLNVYNQGVFTRLEKHLNDAQKAWLREKCKAI